MDGEGERGGTEFGVFLYALLFADFEAFGFCGGEVVFVVVGHCSSWRYSRFGLGLGR